MAQQPAPSQIVLEASPTGAVLPPSASLFGPAIYPLEVVQKLLDQTAYFPLYAVPKRGRTAAISRGSCCYGIQATEVLHRFRMYMNSPNERHGVKAVNTLGEFVGKAELRWMIIPDNFVALRGSDPPGTELDPSRSQRLSMLQTELSFGDGRDAFRCFGTGRTFPGARNSRSELLVAASGDITEGIGIFRHVQGTCIFVGRLDPEAGFIGTIITRIPDPDDRLTAELPSVECHPEIELEATYFLFRGQKRDLAKTASPSTTQPGGAQGGFNLNQDVRTIYPDCCILGFRGLRSSRLVGAIIGNQASSIQFDPTQLPNLRKPFATIPFRGENIFTFVDECGHEIASIRALAPDGTIFNLHLDAAPRQPGVRIAGYGLALDGTGTLSGVNGLFHSIAFNALPPIPSSLYVIRIADPQGSYRV
jgi:hypothetical protein